MPKRGEVVPRPLLNYRCNFTIEASNVGEDKLPILVDVVENKVLGGQEVSDKGSTNHPQFPQTVFVEITQDRLDVFDLIDASMTFTRRIGMDSRVERGFNHLLTVVGEAQISNVLPRPFANVQGVNEQIDFEIEFSDESDERISNAMYTIMGKYTTVKDFTIQQDGRFGTKIVVGTTGQGILSVNSMDEIIDELNDSGVIAENFNITCTVTEIVRV